MLTGPPPKFHGTRDNLGGGSDVYTGLDAWRMLVAESSVCVT